MGYSDQKYYSRPFQRYLHAASCGTATTATVASTPALYLPKFPRRTQITAVRMTVTTIPNAAATALKANFLNGTATFATVTLTTATAGQVLSGTVTASNAVFAADGQPTFTVNGTATASADALGAYHFDFETQELP